MAGLLQRLSEALRSHDAARVAALVAERYESSQPIHPARSFIGRDQVLANWTSVFEGIPDFRAELVSSAVDGDVEWGEWDWRGHHLDGSPFAMRGVVILVASDDLIASKRLYLEPVEFDGGDIDASVEDLYRPPAEDPA
jgi:hypothetical protein